MNITCMHAKEYDLKIPCAWMSILIFTFQSRNITCMHAKGYDFIIPYA